MIQNTSKVFSVFCEFISEVQGCRCEGGLDCLEDRRRETFRAEEAPGVGDVTALATECLSEAGASCTWINLGKQCEEEEEGVGRGGGDGDDDGDDDDYVYEQKKRLPELFQSKDSL